MDAITVPFKQTNRTERLSSETLASIQRYVDPSPFTLRGLSRGLGRTDQSALLTQLIWLIGQGYVERLSLESMRLTSKGKKFSGDYLDDEEGFEIEFSAKRAPQPIHHE